VERYLPDTGTWALPSNPTRLVVSGHIVRLLKEYAELREFFWREEAKQPIVDTAQFADEIAWWRRLREFCADYRDWRTRLELIRHAARFTERTGHFSAAISAEDSGLDRHAWRSSGPATHDGGSRSDPRLRVLRWLEQSQLINADADAVVRDRNTRLDVLNRRLS
jgi:post-segregation antitoxin (ccd killing protein)